MRKLLPVALTLFAAAAAALAEPAKPATTRPAPFVGTVNLIAMGDWGTGGPDQRAVAAAMAGYVTANGKPFDGALLVGDNFYMDLPGGVADPAWQAVFEKMYDPVALPFPFYAALGNHDYLNGKDATELAYAKARPGGRWKMPGRWYRVDLPAEHPTVTALMLDSDKDDLSADQWEAEKAWMEAELSKPRGTWTLCCGHHPLFSNGGHGDNGVLQKQWGPILLKHEVDFYVCGHDHDLQHLQIPNWFTSFLLVGGGGADTKLMRHDDRGPLSRLKHGFAHLAFTPDQAVVRYVDEDGDTIHLFTRAKDGTVTVQRAGGNDKAVVNPFRLLEAATGYTPPATKPATKPATR